MSDLHAYPYQNVGADFLASRRYAYLADGMGMGKSVQFCLAARQIDPRSTLMICPAAAVENWYREWERWGPDRPFKVVSYNKACEMDLRRYALVGGDEAHYAKNRAAQRTKVLLRFAKAADQAALLSGTPMPNHPGELYPAIYALWPGVMRRLGLKNYNDWFNYFCKWRITDYGPRVYDTQNEDKLKPFLQRLMLKRSKKDVGLQLPPLRVDVSLLPANSAFAASLQSYGRDPADLKRRMENEERHDCPRCRGTGDEPGNEQFMCRRCKGSGDQEGSMSRLRRLLGEYKAPFIADQIFEELDTDQYNKIVVMAYHRSVLEVFRAKLMKFGVTGFDGSTPSKARQIAIDTFTMNDSCRVFVAQQGAAGVAVNLQVSSEIVLVEPDWSPDKNAQAIMRIHRIGTGNPCRARYFAVAGTLDEQVLRVESAKVERQVNFGLAA